MRRPWLWSMALCLATLDARAADLLIRGAKVHTVGAAGTLPNANILVRDGRIAAVGPAVSAAGAEVIDASGLVVTPGLFEAYSQLGLKEIDGVDQSVDDATKDARFTASIDVTDALNPRSTVVAVNLTEGVTRAVTAPLAGERNTPVAGFGAIVNLGSIDAFVMRPRVALFMAGGEEAAGLLGGSRPAAFAWLREAFEEARNPKLWTGRPNREPLLSPLDAVALKPVLEGKAPLVVTAHRAADLQALMRLADEYKMRLIIRGGAEAHLVARELATWKIPVILDPTQNLPDRFESLAARDDTAARLQRAGVLIAFAGDDSSHNARNVRQLAGNAVARGLPWDAALAAITLNPARIFGVDSALGSVEAGKRADLVVWDGDPLEVTSFPKVVIADGRIAPAQNRQTQLRDRYRQRLNR